MLNDSQRTTLRIVMGLIEDKMRAIEQQLVHPEERRVMSEVRNNVTPKMEQALRQRIMEVYRLIGRLKERFALPMETKLASREILKGLPQLWVMLQESDSKRLRGYGEINQTDADLLDPDIAKLADFMFDLEQIVLPQGASNRPSIGEEQKIHERRIAG